MQRWRSFIFLTEITLYNQLVQTTFCSWFHWRRGVISLTGAAKRDLQKITRSHGDSFPDQLWSRSYLLQRNSWHKIKKKGWMRAESDTAVSPISLRHSTIVIIVIQSISICIQWYTCLVRWQLLGVDWLIQMGLFFFCSCSMHSLLKWDVAILLLQRTVPSAAWINSETS